MKYIRAQEQKPKPIDQSLRRRNTTSTIERKLLLQLTNADDPTSTRSNADERATTRICRRKIEIQPMDMSNPYSIHAQ